MKRKIKSLKLICNRKLLKRAGFTLIEVMVTMSIISLLSSIVFSSVQSARAKATDSATEAQANQFKTAITLYKNDNGQYPQAPSGHTISLSGRNFNVGCLGIGCILDGDDTVSSLPPGTLSRYINDTQETIAPKISTDSGDQKGIFLLTCSDPQLCNDEAYLMFTQTIPVNGLCTGSCVLYGPGGSLVLSNINSGSGQVVGGSCSNHLYDSTSKVICESHGTCAGSGVETQSECGVCKDYNGNYLYEYTTDTSCVNNSSGFCYAVYSQNQYPAYVTASDCTAWLNGYCSDGVRVINSYGITNPNECADAGRCYDSNGNEVWPNNSSDHQSCTDAGYNWVTSGFSWQYNEWVTTNNQWESYGWTPETWTPSQ